jgi:hypothetical protein
MSQAFYQPQSHPPYARTFGDTEIVVVSDGPLDLGAPEDSFRGLSKDEIDEQLLRSFLPTDKVVIEQNVPRLTSGGKMILFEVANPNRRFAINYMYGDAEELWVPM